MTGLLRFNLVYLNLLILLAIVLKLEFLILFLMFLRISTHSYRIMLIDLTFSTLDGLRKNYFFADMLEHKTYQEFEIETSDFDGYFNFENYAINNISFLPEIYGGDFSLNWEDFIFENFRFNLNNKNNLNKIYKNQDYYDLTYYKLFNKSEFIKKKIEFDYINLYDYYYYHKKSFEQLNFDFNNEKFHYNFYKSKCLDEDYFNLHLNNNEIKKKVFDKFLTELKNNIKERRIKSNIIKLNTILDNNIINNQVENNIKDETNTD